MHRHYRRARRRHAPAALPQRTGATFGAAAALALEAREADHEPTFWVRQADDLPDAGASPEEMRNAEPG